MDVQYRDSEVWVPAGGSAGRIKACETAGERGARALPVRSGGKPGPTRGRGAAPTAAVSSGPAGRSRFRREQAGSVKLGLILFFGLMCLRRAAVSGFIAQVDRLKSPGIVTLGSTGDWLSVRRVLFFGHFKF